MALIKKFTEVSLDDVALVGGKNASLGEMIRTLTTQGIRIPQGFATTADAYWLFIKESGLESFMREQLTTITDIRDIKQVQRVGAALRSAMISASLPQELEQAILGAYKELSHEYKQKASFVAVRSSATAEDLPSASFAGQHDTFLFVHGEKELLIACKKAYASLFNDRAIVYRHEQNIDHMHVAMSLGIQKMVRSDKACAGVMFTLDTESGFKDLITITSSYGLGETIVQGSVNPDEFYVHKPTLQAGYAPLVKKYCGDKSIKLVHRPGDTELLQVAVTQKNRVAFSLTDSEVFELARYGLIIEEHYSHRLSSKRKGSWEPMDIEWAKDGDDGLLYIVQARPETVHKSHQEYTRYHMRSKLPQELIEGHAIGQKIVAGKARIVNSIHELSTFNQGDILVTKMTDPDWVPLMRKAGGIVTDLGGRTCHAAIVSRELGLPAIIGTGSATKIIKDGQELTLDCSQGLRGVVYPGILQFDTVSTDLGELKKSPVDLLINLADPDRACELSFLPVKGVGLARLEFIITNMIKVHPMAIAAPEKVTNKRVLTEIRKRAQSYPDAKTFFIDTLAQAVGLIAAAFYPRPVIVRLTDFKSNEYKNLLGGAFFEPQEENPMLGFRGAVRYVSKEYAPAFALECAALKKVREEMGLTNVKIMVPFVRTVEEARKTVKLLAQHGLERGKHGLELFMMVEIPSNVILIEEFAQLFDGFSIGSNDLTQLTLGVDRDSGVLSHIFDERDPAVMCMLSMAIAGAHKAGTYIGICGQAPSDFPEIAEFLIKQKINSLSLNPDSVIPFLEKIKSE